MNLEQLQTVWNVLRSLNHAVSTAGKMLSASRYGRVEDMAKAAATENTSRRDKLALTKHHVMLDYEDPLTFFSHFGNSGRDIFRILRNAQDQERLKLDRIAKATQEVTDPKTIREMRQTRHTFIIGRGDTLTLTTPQIMDLYLLSRRPQSAEHLTVGGVVQPAIPRQGNQPRIERGTQSIPLAAEDLSAITNTLSKEQKAMADSLQKLTGLLARWGNEASMAVYGYRKFLEENYWPIRSAREAVHSDIEKGGHNARSVKNIGMAKNTVPHANNALDLGDVFEVFAEHTQDMIRYSTLLAPMEDLSRLYNFRYRDADGNYIGKTFKGELDRVGGTGSQAYWMKLMEDLQNGIGRSGTNMDRMVNRIVGNTKAAAVGANLRVVIQQPSAWFRAGLLLSPDSMARGLIGGVTKGRGWTKAKKHAPIARIKEAGGFDQGNLRTIQQDLYGLRTVGDNIREKSMAGAAAADAVTWSALWNACEWEIKKRYQDLSAGNQEFYQKTSELFTRVIEETQVVDGILQRPPIMRSPDNLSRQVTSFMGEPLKTFNILLRSWDQARYETNPKNRSAAKRRLGRAISAVVIASAANAALASLIDALRDDDEDKGYWDRYLTALTGLTGDEEAFSDYLKSLFLDSNLSDNLNPLGVVPYLRDALSIAKGYSVERMDASAFGDLCTACVNFLTSIGGDGKKTRAYALKELLTAVSKVTGISVTNLGRDAWGSLRSYAIGTGDIGLLYDMEKAISNLSNDANQSKFLDLAFQALSQGQMETYDRICTDLTEQMGISGKDIESGMRSRYNKAVKGDPAFTMSEEAKDLIGVLDTHKLPEDEDEDENDFNEEDLNPEAYRQYAEKRADTYREIVDVWDDNAQFQSLDEEMQNKAWSSAYALAKETALADASDGAYTITTKWMEWAVGGSASGVDEAEAVLFKVAYDMTEGDKDKDGKTVPGSKKENVLEVVDDWMPWLTDRELEYLKSGFWKE